MMDITIDTHPAYRIQFLVPQSNSQLKLEAIEVFFGQIKLNIKTSIEALIITADLQGVVLRDTLSKELVTESFSNISLEELNQMESDGLIEILPVGLVIPDNLKALLLERKISSEKVLALLCGDLFGTTKRGGSGEVTNIWENFENTFGKVVGVLGNHDILQADASFHLLDGNIISFEGLQIGGISGVIGNPKKVNRKDPNTYRLLLTGILQKKPDIVIIHECPEVTTDSLPGREDLARWLKESRNGTFICTGHVPWNVLMADIPPHKILNIEQRVVILENKSI